MNASNDLKEIEALRALLASRPRPVGWAERRLRLDGVGALTPVAADITLTAADVDGVRGEWSLAPGSDASRVLLYFHGGGYCAGSIVSHRRMVTEAGRAAGIRTLAIDYRLAPEHPFPAALDDAAKAWRWLRRQGIAASRIVVGGDSAGGGIGLALILHLRAAKEELPAACWLMSPWTDFTLSSTTLETKDSIDPIIRKDYLAELIRAYLPAGVDTKDPRVSAVHGDLTGFPPMLIQVGSAETLLDDAAQLAAVAGRADVSVALEVWPHMVHVWPLWGDKLTAGREAIANAGAFMRRHL